MSPWRHAQCHPCWVAAYGDRLPVRVQPPEKEKCCWCGALTTSGIYVRADPKPLLCKGLHEETA